MESPHSLFLVNLVEGDVRGFDDADQLVAYLRHKNESGSLMGESTFTIFFGRHLCTERFFNSAFNKKEEVTS